MKHIKLLALVAALIPCLSQGASVITNNFATGAVGGPTSNPIIFSGALAPGNAGIVAVGIFNSTDAQISGAAGNPANWATVAASFQQFGASVTIGNGAGGTAGLFSAAPGQAVAAPFEGKNVYVAIGNAASLAASSQVVVFKATSTFLPEPNPSVNAFLTDTPAAGNPPAGEFLLGALGAGNVWYTTGPLANMTISGVIGAVIVPEPTTALLGLVSLGFGFIRRRR